MYTIYLLYHKKFGTNFGINILNYLVEREELNNQVDEMVTISLHLTT